MHAVEVVSILEHWPELIPSPFSLFVFDRIRGRLRVGIVFRLRRVPAEEGK